MIINPMRGVRCLSGEFLNYHLSIQCNSTHRQAVKDSPARSWFLKRGGERVGSPNKLVAIDSCDPAAAPQAYTMSSLIADSASGITETVKEGNKQDETDKSVLNRVVRAGRLRIPVANGGSR